MYTQLGASGLTVSTIGLGCNTFGDTVAPEDVKPIVDAALDAGVTLFDTADIYGGQPGQGEQLLGRALGQRRRDVVVATKFGMDPRGLNGPDWGVRGSARYIIRAVEGSLRRLSTDYIDLYQMHVPDPMTPIEETLTALDALVTSGKVRYLGSSNFAAWQVVEAEYVANQLGAHRFISAQNAYNLMRRDVEAELVPACEAYGIGILPYYPLASGILTGKYQRDTAAPEGSRLAKRGADRLKNVDWDRVEALQEFARQRDLPLAHVAIGWLLAQPVVGSVISGASSPQQVHANVAAGEWSPSPEELAALDEIA